MTVSKWIGGLVGGALFVSAASASAQSVVLRSGFMPDPQTRGGISGGPVPASSFNPSCRGYIPMVPQHRVVLATPMAFFRIWAQSSSDTTLVVRASTGQVFCADDTWGVNPGVDLRGAMPGNYDVYVGSYAAGVRAPYTIGFTELASSVPGGGSSGGVVLQTPSGPPVGIVVQSPAPPAVVVQQPPPLLAAPAAPPRPSYGYPLAAGFLPDPRLFQGVSGGPLSASSINPACRGYIPVMPSQTVTLTTYFNFLRVWVSSQGDTTLVVRAPNGQVFCADDTYGFNPGVDMRGLPPGSYQVYVGSYSAGTQHPYTLAFTELTSSTPGGTGTVGYVPPPPPPPPPSVYGSILLTSGFMPDPRTLTGIAGGPMSAMAINGSCRGYIPATPNHLLTLNSYFPFLRVYANSAADTTLVIRGPNGQVWCADDTYGFNPGVDLAGAPPGTYQIFVGTYAAGNSAPYTIGFTELQHMHP